MLRVMATGHKPDIGECFQSAADSLWYVVLEYRGPSPAGGMLHHFSGCALRAEVEEWDSKWGGWLPYQSAGCSMYRHDGRIYYGLPLNQTWTPPPWSVYSEKPGFQTRRTCTEHAVVDTGMAVSWCSKCDAKLRFVDWSWVEVRDAV